LQNEVNRILAHLFGDARRFSLEHRLFSTISLLNSLANLGGALRFLDLKNQWMLLALHIGTGLLFLLFYYLSRFRDTYRTLYWPLVFLILVFLFVNALLNAGSTGGAHYYFIPALVIAVILSTGIRSTTLAIILFGATTIALFVLEQKRPGWITPHSSLDERLFDISANFLFVQIFTGILVIVLTKNLNQERRKSDRLLLNILPESVADELKRNDRVEPLQYESATVLFTDFVGFTHISEGLTPQELIRELDMCFSHFDRIVKKHNIEKIKTIGDAYMAAGGLPVANRTHAVDCILAALEIQSSMAEMKEKREREGRPYWQLRLGIHTGPLVAGVIGYEKFAYDVWGDTVNTASRLESSGVAGRINISAATYEAVKDFFECEYRGKVAAKSKGDIDMYFVAGIRSEMSNDDREPNEKFKELYRRLAEGRK
jgi:adenylate cyclase